MHSGRSHAVEISRTVSTLKRLLPHDRAAAQDPLGRILQDAYASVASLFADLGIPAERIARRMEELHAQDRIRPLLDGDDGRLLAIEYVSSVRLIRRTNQ